MKLKDSLKIRIPNGMVESIKFRLSIDPPNFKYNLDNFIFFLNKITKIPSSNRKLENLRMIPIDSRILRAEIGKDYKKYINWLLNNKFIISDFHYVPSKLNKGLAKCICYGYSDSFLNKKLDVYKITKRSLIKRDIIWKFSKLRKKEVVEKDEILLKLEKYLSNLQFDYNAAISKLDEMLMNGKINIKKYNIQKERCDVIKEKKFYLIRCKYGRIHTNFTNLMKELRVYVKNDNCELVGLDIRSCQPALLYAMINEEYNKLKDNISCKKLEIERTETTLKNFSNNDKYTSVGNFYIREDNKLSLHEYLKKDGLFNRNFLNGLRYELDLYGYYLKNDIYDNISDYIFQKTNRKIDRSSIKKEFFTYIFGKNDSKCNFKEVFQKIFPSIDVIVRWIKRYDHTNMAKELQRKESNIVINDLTKSILKDGFSFYTIHDSIYVPIDKKDKVKQKFEEILRKNNILSGLVDENKTKPREYYNFGGGDYLKLQEYLKSDLYKKLISIK